jgi:hypothetical protein
LEATEFRMIATVDSGTEPGEGGDASETLTRARLVIGGSSRAQTAIETLTRARTAIESATNAAESRQLLTEVDLATRWGCSVKKLQADRLKGVGIPYVKLGRLVRYRLSDVLAYEEAHVRNSTTEGGLS